MEWLSTRTREYRKQAKECWHYWFAWHPVTVKTYPDGAAHKVWLQRVLRKGTLHPGWYDPDYWTYKYRLPN